MGRINLKKKPVMTECSDSMWLH